MPLAGVGLVLAYVLYSRWHYFSVVLRSRVQTGGASSSAHFAVYDFIPQIIHSHPLLGLGLNNVLRLLRVRHRQDELGAALVLGRAHRRDGARRARCSSSSSSATSICGCARRGCSGGTLGADGRDVRSLAWGMTAALTGTIASNFFYLTMTFYYFYAFVALALALPVVFGCQGRKIRGR